MCIPQGSKYMRFSISWGCHFGKDPSNYSILIAFGFGFFYVDNAHVGNWQVGSLDVGGLTDG